MSTEQKIIEAMQAGDFCTALELQVNEMMRFATLPGNSPEQTGMATSSASAIRALIAKCAKDGATFQECCQLVMAGRQMGIAETLVAANVAQLAPYITAPKPH